jgi:hypothetical protein
MAGDVPLADEDLPLGMTDLEERLLGADGDAARSEVLSTLDQLKLRLTSEAGKGLPPDAFKTYQTLERSLAAARAIVIASRNFKVGKDGPDARNS